MAGFFCKKDSPQITQITQIRAKAFYVGISPQLKFTASTMLEKLQAVLVCSALICVICVICGAFFALFLFCGSFRRMPDNYDFLPVWAG